MKKYIIFGTGSIAQEYFEKLTNKYGTDCVEYFIDSMLSKQTFCNKKVIKPAQLKEIKKNDYTYLLGTFTSKKSMENELKRQGVNKENILIKKDYGSNSFEESIFSVKKILLYPETDNEAFLKDLDKQFSALVPNVKNLSEKPDIASNSKIHLENINITEVKKEPDQYDLILVWDKNRLEDIELQAKESVYCIDPNYFRLIDVRILLRLNNILEKEEEKKCYIQSSKENYKNFAEKYAGSDSYVFGTGPSCRVGSEIIFDNKTIRIVCNNFLDNKVLINKINPNIYVLSDENTMSADYYNTIDKICQYVIRQKCLFIVPDILGAVLINRYPQLIHTIVRISFDTNTINFPTPENLTVYRKAYNTITLLAIPVASFLSNNINILGCDGINLNAQSFSGAVWAHDKELEKQESFQNHRKESEENWNEEYYLKHISYFEELLSFGEKQAKKYIPYTNSFIPALNKRYSEENRNYE